MSKLTRKVDSRLTADLACVFGLTLLAGFVFTDDLMQKGATYWDNVYFYSMFWNQIDSLNRFGEFAWWFPANQFGWPAYYYSILGDTACASPAFAILGFTAWLSGKLGFQPYIYGMFTFYVAFFIPGLVNLAAYCVLRQLLRSRAAILFGLMLSAFSPGVAVNISDVGFLEPLAYSLFFFAAWLNFLRRPGPLSFWSWMLSLCALAVTIGFPFILWNLFFVPLAVALSVFAVPGGYQSARAAFRSRPAWNWALAVGLAFVCALPALLIFSQTGDLIRQTLGQQFYNFRDLNWGNPLEMFAVSLPSFGFEWRDKNWALLLGGQGYHVSVVYISLLCLPLTFVALLYARPVVRLSLVLFFALFGAVMCLSAWSPFFSLLIRAVPPLQSNSHWTDLGFRGGAYLLLILLASLGFELLALGHRRAIRAAPWLLLLNFTAATALFAAYSGTNMFSNPVFGLLTTLTALMAVVIAWLRAHQSQRARRAAVGLLLGLTLVDVATFSYVHMRTEMKTLWYKAINRTERMDQETVGLARIGDYGKGDYAEHILMYKQHYEMLNAQLLPWTLARFKLFDAARAPAVDLSLTQNIEAEKKLMDERAFEKSDSLLVDASAKSVPAFQPFFANQAPPIVTGTVEVQAQTYNDLWLKVKSNSAALLFVRDGYSPYWKAEVGDQPAPVARALFNYKAVAVPAGESLVHLHFAPPGVGLAWFLAYVVMLALASLCARLLWRKPARAAKRVR